MTAVPLDAEFLKTLTVLYVEDDPGAGEEVSAFLRRRVRQLATATQGAEGLAAFQAAPVDLVITDIQMPVMDGLTMAQEIRKTAPAVPIIVTTAFEQTDYLARSLEIGIDHYVMKPVRATRLEYAMLQCAHRLLAEEQMRQKQELEAEVQRVRHQATISTLLGGIGHDYNNLLQAILSSQDLALLCAEPGSKVHRILAASTQAGDQTRQLSRRLLALVNPADLVLQVGPIEHLLRDTVLAELAESPITAEFDFQGGDLPLRHDEPTLRQALVQLVLNAKEAMPRGGVLQVSTRSEESPDPEQAGLSQGRYLHVSIRDTGKGIAPEDLPVVFEPYFTTRERDSQRGTGLGLALCEATIRAHGGSIRADSTLGQGSIFHVLLPLA
jgi:signal transduction histidine kinase